MSRVTETEKAKEFIVKFFNGITSGFYEWSGVNEKKKTVNYRAAKRCAIIGVDEILKSYPNVDKQFYFLQRVKEEIIKL